MIARDRVAEIVNARLTDEQLVAELKQLSTENISLEILKMFIEETRLTADGGDKLPSGRGLIDVSGTGGSGLAHFNTSTFCAFVLASGGVRVAKFGNRASRSGAGSADLLEALGIPLDLPPGRVAEVIDSAGVAFLFAPHYYPGLKKLAYARKAVGQPTVFNHIGPLLNPINPEFRLLGISSGPIYPLIVEHLTNVSSKSNGLKTLVVRSEHGIDELIPGCNNAAFHVAEGATQDLTFNAKGNSPFASPDGKTHHLDLAHNVSLFRALLEPKGEIQNQSWLDLVCLNSAAGFFVAGKVDSIEKGIDLAKSLIATGETKGKFEDVRRAYEKCAA